MCIVYMAAQKRLFLKVRVSWWYLLLVRTSYNFSQHCMEGLNTNYILILFSIEGWFDFLQSPIFYWMLFPVWTTTATLGSHKYIVHHFVFFQCKIDCGLHRFWDAILNPQIRFFPALRTYFFKDILVNSLAFVIVSLDSFWPPPQ